MGEIKTILMMMLFRELLMSRRQRLHLPAMLLHFTNGSVMLGAGLSVTAIFKYVLHFITKDSANTFSSTSQTIRRSSYLRMVLGAISTIYLLKQLETYL